MMTALDRLRTALESYGSRVTGSGSRLSAQCPAHDDRNASLSVTGIEGQALVYCHAGCDTVDVLAKLNLGMADLFDEQRATYRYDDGRTVTRYYRGDKKRFSQFGHTSNRTSLYRLEKVRPAVAAGKPVFVVEGEKDVHALETLGVTATCSPMGAGKADRCDWTPLAGAQVLIVADRDAPGEKHAQQILNILTGLKCQAAVFAARSGKDAADHIAAGHSVAELVKLDVTAAERLVDEGPRRRVRLTPASEITARTPQWMWDQRIPEGVIGLWAGREGIGKSLGAAWLTAQLTNGTLPGVHEGHARTVIYSAAEDSWSHVLVPRLMAAGADLSRVYRIEVAADHSGDGLPISLPADLAEFEQSVREVAAAAVILDPLFSVLSAALDTKDERKLRTALDPMKAIADRTRCTIVGIVHFNKGTSKDVSDRIQGARGFSNVTRSTTSFGRLDDDQDGNAGVLSTTKNTNGRDFRSGLESLTYTIDSATVRTVDGLTEVGKLRFTGTTDTSVSDTLEEVDADANSERAEAAEWLLSYLTDHGGSARAGEVIKAAARDGIAKTTLTRARKRAGIASVKDGMNGGWMWSLEPRRDHEETEESASLRGDSSVSSVDSSDGNADPLGDILGGDAA